MRLNRKFIFSFARIGVGVGLLVYLGLSGVIDWSILLNLTEAWPMTLLAFLILIFDLGITSYRLCVLMKPHGLTLPLSASLRLTFIGNFFNACLPGATGGDVVKIYYAMDGNPNQKTEVATIMLLDRALGMTGMFLLPVVVAPFAWTLVEQFAILQGLLIGAAAAAGLMVGTLGCAMNQRICERERVKTFLQGLPFGIHVRRILDTVVRYRSCPGVLVAGVGISLFAHLLLVGLMIVLFQVLSPGSIHWTMGVLIPFGFLANAVPVTPGGLGVGEAVVDALFGLVGLKGGAEAMLAWRILMFATGLMGLWCYVAGRKRYFAEPQHEEDVELGKREVRVLSPLS